MFQDVFLFTGGGRQYEHDILCVRDHKGVERDFGAALGFHLDRFFAGGQYFRVILRVEHAQGERHAAGEIC